MSNEQKKSPLAATMDAYIEAANEADRLKAVLQAIATADPSVFPPMHDTVEWVLALQLLATAALDGQAPYQVIRVPGTEALAEDLADLRITASHEQVIMPKWAMEYLVGVKGVNSRIYWSIQQAYLQADGREAPRD